MIMRARDLSIISEDTARRLFVARARRGWSRQEPLDEIVPAEEPLLLKKSFALIFDEAVASPAQVMAELPYSAQDIESLAGLPNGWLAQATPLNIALRSPRPDSSEPDTSGQTVVSFRPRRN
jgi:hypothetical protein